MYFKRLKFINIRKCQGQISIFVSIVFIAVLILTGILVDGSRIIAGETQVRRGIENASRSVLATYNSRLKNDYGLFALSDIEKNRLTENIKSYINKNIMIENNDLDLKNSKTRSINLYDFRIEEISVTPVLNFTRTDITKKQILEYMKYRVPLEITEGILKKAGFLKEIGKVSQVYKRKLDIGEKLGEMEKIQQDLKKSISGTLGDGDYIINYIEKFNSDGVRDLLILDYAYLIKEYKILIARKIEIEKAKDIDICKDIDAEKDKDLQIERKTREEQYNITRKQISEKIQEISKVYSILRGEHTEYFIKLNEEAIKCVKKLCEIGSKVNSGIEDLKEFIENSLNYEIESNMVAEQKVTKHRTMEYRITGHGIADDDIDDVIGDSIIEEFKNTIMEELENLQKIIPDEKSTQKMIEIFENNIDSLKNAIDALDEVHSMVVFDDENRIDISRDEVLERLTEINAHYKIVDFNYSFQGKKSEEKDPRKVLEDIAKDAMKKSGDKGVDLEDAGISIDELPSKKKVQDACFDDICFDVGKYDGSLDGLGEEIEFSKRSANFSKKAFNYISSIGELLAKKLMDMRDDIYISEYVMTMFKNSVGTKNIKEQDKKTKREALFKAEVEYILHGNSLENINILKTKGQILLLRFGLNTVRIFIDSEKRQQATAIAAAIAGWWTGGAGIPIIANLIVCAWGMNEAVSDLRELVEGKAVPLYKIKNAENIGNALKLTYQDYLRLFLLLMDTEMILGRIQDIIEINIGRIRPEFKMSNTYTAVRVEAEVSMKYIFLTRTFMPSKMRSGNGRHLFHIVLYEGY